jgi:superfamily II DNA or RNA helicase
MKICIETPTKAYLTEFTQDELDRVSVQLSYTHTGNAHLLKRLYDNHWFRSKNPEAWNKQLDELKAKQKFTLVFKEDERTYIRPGSIPYLVNLNIQVTNLVNYPKPNPIKWKEPLPFELYPYQEQSVNKLIQSHHSNVELCTGAGKSAILLKICQETGFKTAIIAPSRSIFLELLEKFEHHFGKKSVGRFGDGKKVLDRLFTICISDSIANVRPESKEWDFFSNLEMIAVDESHTWGAESLESICHGVFLNIPYRAFLSGTQIRNSGDTKLLQSIINETVHTLSTKEGVDGGYICPHYYRIVELESSNPNFDSKDAMQQKRAHFLKNRNICSFIAKLVNIEAEMFKRQSLILVDELEQIAMLLPMINVPVAIAHSEKKLVRLEELGLEKVDPMESVDKFNKAEAMVLIGTGCIAVGVNCFANHNTVNWAGGTSPIKTLQGAVGRSVRLYRHNPWKDLCTPKDKCIIWDFKVKDSFLMRKHLEERIGCYEKSGSSIQFIKIKS